MPKHFKSVPDKKKEFIEVYKTTLGIVSQACEKVGISRTTFYEWCKEDANFKAKAEEINEMQIDFVESQLLQNIKKKDTNACIFYLRTKGRKRGYTDKDTNEEPDHINLTVTYKNHNEN